MRGIARALFLIMGLGIAWLGAWMFLLGWEAANAGQQLGSGAVAAVATIDAKDVRSVRGSVKGGQPEYRPDYFVTYHFTTADGVAETVETGVSPTFFKRAVVGGTTPVHYLQSNPKRSEIEFGRTDASSWRPLLFGALAAVVGVVVTGIAVFRPDLLRT